MANRSESLELSMAAEPDSVRLVRGEVLRWFHEQSIGDESLAARVALATSEAVGNVVRHAYGRAGGRVELEATLRGDDLLIRVADRGLGLTARSGSRTGLGLPVIGRVSNGVTVASDESGTTVSMRFMVRPAAVRPPRQRLAARGRPLIGIG